MRRLLFKFISTVIIYSMVLTLVPFDGYCLEGRQELAKGIVTMLAPRLSIPQSAFPQVFEQKNPPRTLLPAPAVMHKKEQRPWLQRLFPNLYKLFQERPLMTVSMEGYHEKYSTQALNANSKGGLGAFFGCLIRGLKANGVKTVAFQPDFSMRRRQLVKLKHDYVVDNRVVGVLSNLNWRNFSASAYPIVESMLELSEKDILSLSNFEKTVMADKESALYTGIYTNGWNPADKQADQIDVGKENIAYVYTAVLSVLVEAAVIGEKINVAERAVRKVFTILHFNGNLNGKAIKKTIEILQHLSREKQVTLDHFTAAIKTDESFSTFIENSGVSYEVLFCLLINYLARIAVTKEQVVVKEPVSYDNEPGEFIKDKDGNEFVVTVGGLNVNNPDQTVYYDIKFRCYFDGNIARVQLVCPELYKLLYDSDSSREGKRQRFNEYMVSSWAMYAFIKHFPEYKPGLIHFNESPFILLNALVQADPLMEDIPSLYTNHTVVAAGLPKYYPDTADLNRLFEIMAGGYAISRQNISFSIKGDLGDKAVDRIKAVFTHEGSVDLSFAAVELADATNGVSDEHAKVTRNLFHTVKDVFGVLNGSSDYWRNEKLIALREREQSGGGDITAGELWDIHQDDGKMRLIAEIEKRTGVRLNANMPVVSLIRRISNYKSQYPILKDIIHVLCSDRGTLVRTRWGELEGLGQQVIVGGFAYTGSDEAGWVEAFLSWMNDPDLRGRFVFVPDSDVELLNLQAIGSDICVNCP
ncbi:MAG: hypothetical protein PHO30_08595, partial [Candidatus Omnitrophica bacterium]|nr:hypothetical protein [Candidatus Omnitrophota bacterium]